MNKFQLILSVLALVIISCNQKAKNEETSQEQTKPNIVLILSDDQAWNDYGFMGHDVIETPSLDKLASQSVLFRRGYVPTPICRPSLMTLATGYYPHQHHIVGNDPKGGSRYPEFPRED
jgi:arylsulfatase A-like enzyme